MNLIWPLPFQVFRSFPRQKTESLLDFNNNCQDPVRILLKLSTFCFCPLQTHYVNLFKHGRFSVFSRTLPSLILSLSYTCMSMSEPPVTLQSPCTLADVMDVNMSPSGGPNRRSPFLFLHQRFIFMLCIPPLGSFPAFSNVSTNRCHTPRLWNAPSLSVSSWRIVNYLIVDLECPRKSQEAMRLMMYCRCCCMFLIVFL